MNVREWKWIIAGAPSRGRYYINVKTEFLSRPWVNSNAV